MINSEEIRTMIRGMLGRPPTSELELHNLQRRFPDLGSLFAEFVVWGDFFRNVSKASAIRQKVEFIKAAELSKHLQANFPQNDQGALRATLKPNNLLSSTVASEALRSLKPNLIVIFGDITCALRWLLLNSVELEEATCINIVCSGYRPELSNAGLAALFEDDAVKFDLQRLTKLIVDKHVDISLYQANLASGLILDVLPLIGLLPDMVILSGEAEVGKTHPIGKALDRLTTDGMLVALNEKTQFKEIEAFRKLAVIHQRDLMEQNETLAICKRKWHFPIAPSRPRITDVTNVSRPQTIALAMIVRNEGHYAVEMLRSVSSLVGFVSCVDTGSTDNTVNVIRSYLAEVAMPYEISITKFTRFDEMRNLAISQVPKNIPWILMLDADEIVSEEDIPKLLDLVSDTEADAFRLPRVNWLNDSFGEHNGIYPDRQGRLFRNKSDGTILYMNPIHEVISGALNMQDSPLRLDGVVGRTHGPHIHHLKLIYKTRDELRDREALYQSLASRPLTNS